MYLIYFIFPMDGQLCTMDVKEPLLSFFPDERNEIENAFDWDKVQWYYEFLTSNNEAGGFFSKGDTDKILERHLGESLYHAWFIAKTRNVSRETKMCDVGSGPGLPGFLFHCLKDMPDITLIDSQKRRLHLLETVLAKDGRNSGHLHFIYARAEDVKLQFALVISRSFVPYPFSAEVCTRLVRIGGVYIPFLGGKDYSKNLELSTIMRNGYELEETIALKNLEFLGKRHIKVLKKTSPPIQNYPRPWKELVKEIQKING